MEMMTSPLKGYGYDDEKEKDGARKESCGTKDRGLTLIITIITRKMIVICCDEYYRDTPIFQFSAILLFFNLMHLTWDVI